MMSNVANLRSVRLEPTLVEYLRFAVDCRLNARLRLFIADAEVGAVEVDHGQIVHAELPGAVGDDALVLLGRMPRMRIEVGNPSKLEPSVKMDWTAAFARPEPITDDMQTRLCEIFGLATVTDLPQPGAPATARFDEVFAQATSAYLRRDYARALELFEDCARQRPDDRRVAFNISRLRDRMGSR